MTFSSNLMPGNDSGSEPVLIITFSVSIIVYLFFELITEILLEDLKLAVPL